MLEASEGGPNVMELVVGAIGKMGEYVKSPGTKVDWSQYAEHGYEKLEEQRV